MTCFFTGHRIIKMTDGLSIPLTETLAELIENGAADFYAGGAIGRDMLCEDTVLRLKTDYPHIKLHLVLPCPPEEQTAKWNASQKKKFYRIYESADSIEILSEAYHKDCMRIRNARLVELGDICVCCYNESHNYGGTYQTVNMAMRQGRKIINLWGNKSTFQIPKKGLLF